MELTITEIESRFENEQTTIEIEKLRSIGRKIDRRIEQLQMELQSIENEITALEYPE